RQPGSPAARQPGSPAARQPGSVEAGLALAGPMLAALERLAKPARGQRSGTVFRHADLRPADLRGTDLSTADLLQTCPTGALAGERFDCGEGAAVIAKDLRVSERSVERRRRAWWEGAMTALASTGPPKLSDGQFASLEQEFALGPAAHGWEGQGWTSAPDQGVDRPLEVPAGLLGGGSGSGSGSGGGG
ncbi:pentapeptide repeat-containing protein, partial [Streptomyces bottropensis]|uniref:pentapeptide repeat-containing protein n=1 Tax=Streptomyces bottropensis TaxID=42235 RepID=UPI0036CF6E24